MIGWPCQDAPASEGTPPDLDNEQSSHECLGANDNTDGGALSGVDFAVRNIGQKVSSSKDMATTNMVVVFTKKERGGLFVTITRIGNPVRKTCIILAMAIASILASSRNFPTASNDW